MERDVRHDLNNILSTIITYADLLVQDLDPESAEYKFAQAIFQSGVQAMEQVNGKSVDLEQPEHAVDSTRRSEKHLLLVDDQMDMLTAMQIILEQSGYRVDTCGSADELTALLRQKRGYDLVVLDESMPEEQGHEIAARLDREYPGLPVLLVTGYNKEEVLPRISGISCVRGIAEKSTMVTQLAGTVDRILF